MPESSTPVIRVAEKKEELICYIHRCRAGSQRRAIKASRAAKQQRDEQIAQLPEISRTKARVWHGCLPEATDKPLGIEKQATEKDLLAVTEHMLLASPCTVWYLRTPYSEF